jgi:hypothetical protein
MAAYARRLMACLALIVRKLLRPAELGARSHSPLPAFSSALADQVTLEVGDAARSVDSSRPCELEVSQSGSPSDRNAAPALPMRAPFDESITCLSHVTLKSRMASSIFFSSEVISRG